MAQNSGTWENSLEYAALSDIGLRRTNNQDSMAVVIADSPDIWQRRGHLFVVADGMGAHAAGELASQMATNTVTLAYSKLVELSPPDALRESTIEANRQIHERGESDPEFRGMGTTSTAMALLPQGAVVAHVGDSRAYRLRGNRLEQLTFDHSLIWELRAAGQVASAEIDQFIPKNIITRSLGPSAEVQVDLEGPFPVAVGDTFLLCSDGLCGPLEDDEIGAILGAMTPAEAIHALVDLANLRGGPDNITAIVVRVTGPLASPTAERGWETARNTKPKPIHPVWWTGLGVAGLAAAGAALMQLWVAALVCGLVATLAGVAMLVQRYGGEDDDGSNRRPLGKGPHRSTTTSANGQLVERVGQIVEQLREAAVQEGWVVDWSLFDPPVEEARRASQSGEHAQAFRHYFRAIHTMIVQLRLQRATGAGDEPEGQR